MFAQQQQQPSVVAAQPVVTAGVVVAEPVIAQPVIAQPVMVQPVVAQPGEQAPLAAQMHRGHKTYTVQAFGFVIPEREYVYPASTLQGCYIAPWTTICWFPCPSGQCVHFKAVDRDTLELDLTCCCLVPLCVEKSVVKRDYPMGYPNQFTVNQSSTTTFEFGRCNGLCAGASGDNQVYDHCCYLRVC